MWHVLAQRKVRDFDDFIAARHHAQRHDGIFVRPLSSDLIAVSVSTGFVIADLDQNQVANVQTMDQAREFARCVSTGTHRECESVRFRLERLPSRPLRGIVLG